MARCVGKIRRADTALHYLSKKALFLYLISILFMVSLSLVAGQDPYVGVYILGSKDSTEKYAALVREAASNVLIITPREEFNELNILTLTNRVKLFILADYSNPGNTGIVLEAMRHVEAICILVVEKYRNQGFYSLVINNFPDKAVVVNDWQLVEFVQSFALAQRDGAHFGLSREPYILLAGVVALFSLEIIFAGTLYLSTSVLEAGKRGWVDGMLHGAILGVSVFVLSQLAYIHCSSVLNMPVSLHSNTYGICAISLIGPFGGGSLPRMLVAFAGLATGLYDKLMDMDGGLRRVEFVFSLISVVILASITRFFVYGLFVDSIAYQVMIFITRDLLHITPDFFFQPARGIMLGFAGFVLLGTLPKLSKITRILVLCFCSLTMSWGMMRVGNMQIAQSTLSMFPGLIIGLVLSFAAVSINAVEKVIRHKLQKGNKLA